MCTYFTSVNSHTSQYVTLRHDVDYVIHNVIFVTKVRTHGHIEINNSAYSVTDSSKNLFLKRG